MHAFTRIALSLALTVPVMRSVARAFPAPITANPASEYTAAITPNYQQVQSFTRTLYFDPATLPNTYPKLYWFKYTSDGNSRVKFDTLGSDFGTNGPGNPTSSGPVLGSYNQSQIAVYRADGTRVAITKGAVGRDGNPITLYPNYNSNPANWYYAQGLSELYFEPNAPANPRWNASPSDPTPYTGWAAPGNEGNSQRYYQPYYYTNLNEYQVWNTALSPVVLDAQGQPVINPDTGQPRPQPGWRYYDRARVGPASTWNRYETLPAGDYYVAISSPQPTFAGDTYTEEVLRAPIHFDYGTFQNNQPKLTGPLGAWQYYLDDVGTQDYYGSIRLNVTTTPLADPVWIRDDDGAWTTAANWSGAVPLVPGATAKFGPVISADRTVSVGEAITVGAVRFDSSHRYTIAGSGSLTLNGYDGTGVISAATGSHRVDVPAHFNTTLELNVASSAARLSIPNLQPGTHPLIKTGPGVAEVGSVTAYSISVDGGTLRLTTPQVAGRVLKVAIQSGAELDLGSGGLVIDYGGPTAVGSPIASVRSWLQSGALGTSTAGLRVGYAEAAALGLSSFLNQPSVDQTALLLRATYAGDTNLDGTVDFADLLALAQSYGLANRVWSQGDFDYDASVGFADLLLLAQNYNQSFQFESDWQLARALVPEPSSALLASLSVAAAGRRRRRRD